MKRVALIGLSIFLFFGMLFSQSIVTTRPQKKAVVLEEYTGMKCPACPSGHSMAESILSSHTGKFFIINVHTGYYANPSNASQPDFRTPFGSALSSQTGLGGYPSATINRHLFPDLSEEGGTALYRNVWTQATERTLAEPSPVNIGLTTSYDATSRNIEINLEAYYVDNPRFGIESNFIQIALIESNVFGYQSGQGNSYNHKYILRDLITGQWGEEIEDISAESLITKTYNYTLSEDYVPENCSIVAFITETRQEILTGASAPIINGEHNGEITPDYGRLIISNNNIKSGEEGEVSDFDVKLLNGLNEEQNVKLSLVKNAPEDWNISFTIDGTDYEQYADLTLSADEVKNIKLNITPGSTLGVAQCELILTSESYPEESQKIIKATVVSGVKNLIVNGSGTKNGILSNNFTQVYENALTEAGCSNFGAIPGANLQQAKDLGILDDVDNIYMNIGASLPVLSKAQAIILMEFADNGGNIFIAGQDVLKDIWNSGQGSTGIKQKIFSQNYMSALLNNNGSSSNNSITSTSDSIYSNIEETSLYNPYGSAVSLSPEEINIHESSNAIFTYPNGATAGIKNYKGSSRIIYLGFGLEQIENEEVRNAIIDRTYRWFSGWEGSDVETQNMKNIEIFPNPVADKLFIPEKANKSIYQIFNLNGQLVKSGTIQKSLDVSKLKSGMYNITIKTDNEIYKTKFVKE